MKHGPQVRVKVTFQKGKGSLVMIPHPLDFSYSLEVWVPTIQIDVDDSIPFWLYAVKIEERTRQKNQENPSYQVINRKQVWDILRKGKKDHANKSRLG